MPSEALSQAYILPMEDRGLLSRQPESPASTFAGAWCGSWAGCRAWPSARGVADVSVASCLRRLRCRPAADAPLHPGTAALPSLPFHTCLFLVDLILRLTHREGGAGAALVCCGCGMQAVGWRLARDGLLWRCTRVAPAHGPSSYRSMGMSGPIGRWRVAVAWRSWRASWPLGYLRQTWLTLWHHSRALLPGALFQVFH